MSDSLTSVEKAMAACPRCGLVPRRKLGPDESPLCRDAKACAERRRRQGKYARPLGFWRVRHPGCGLINYYLFHSPTFYHTKVPILRCRCGRYFSFREAAQFIGGVCEPATPTPLVRRQAEIVELETPRSTETT